jgi:hypothetical protein
MLGAHARIQKFVADMDGVTDRHGEAYGAPSLAELVPVLNNSTD